MLMDELSRTPWRSKRETEFQSVMVSYAFGCSLGALENAMNVKWAYDELASDPPSKSGSEIPAPPRCASKSGG